MGNLNWRQLPFLDRRMGYRDLTSRLYEARVEPMSQVFEPSTNTVTLSEAKGLLMGNRLTRRSRFFTTFRMTREGERQDKNCRVLKPRAIGLC